MQGLPATGQFVEVHRNPSMKAFAETNIILAAYLDGLSSLLVLTEQPDPVDHIAEGMLRNLLTLRDVRAAMQDALDKGDVMLEVIEARLSDGI